MRNPDNVPDLYRILARNQIARSAFVHFEGILDRHGRLARDEQAVVALEVAISRRCNYCCGVLTREAREAGVGEDSIQAILHGFKPSRARYRHLLDATRRLMSEWGAISHAEMALFEELGVSFDELLEIIAIMAAFALATYANNLARTRIDPEYR